MGCCSSKTNHVDQYTRHRTGNHGTNQAVNHARNRVPADTQHEDRKKDQQYNLQWVSSEAVALEVMEREAAHRTHDEPERESSEHDLNVMGEKGGGGCVVHNDGSAPQRPEDITIEVLDHNKPVGNDEPVITVDNQKSGSNVFQEDAHPNVEHQSRWKDYDWHQPPPLCSSSNDNQREATHSSVGALECNESPAHSLGSAQQWCAYHGARATDGKGHSNHTVANKRRHSCMNNDKKRPPKAFSGMTNGFVVTGSSSRVSAPHSVPVMATGANMNNCDAMSAQDASAMSSFLQADVSKVAASAAEGQDTFATMQGQTPQEPALTSGSAASASAFSAGSSTSTTSGSDPTMAVISNSNNNHHSATRAKRLLDPDEMPIESMYHRVHLVQVAQENQRREEELRKEREARAREMEEYKKISSTSSNDRFNIGAFGNSPRRFSTPPEYLHVAKT